MFELPRRGKPPTREPSLRVGGDGDYEAEGRPQPGTSLRALQPAGPPSNGFFGAEATGVLSQKERLAAERKARFPLTAASAAPRAAGRALTLGLATA